MKPISSIVPGHEGPCKPTWLNRSQIDRSLFGRVTGFFRSVTPRIWFGRQWGWRKVGEEFHGALGWGGHDGNLQIVESTARKESTP